MKKILLFIITFGFIISACDKIETPYIEEASTTADTTSTVKLRRILIEDYTGHTCGNCPSAALVAGQLKDTYGDQVVVMGVHAGWFAKPKSGPEYTTDFRNTDSEIYDQTFGNSIAGNPNGLISRKESNGSLIIQPANWETALLSLIELEADISIEIESEYAANTNQIDIVVNTKMYNTLPEEYALVISFVEDSIVDWQKDYTLPSGQQDIESYTHRHVFRGNINTTWGDDLSASSLLQDAEESYNFTFTPDVSWNIEKSYIVAYVYNKNTYEIIQVAETHASSH